MQQQQQQRLGTMAAPPHNLRGKVPTMAQPPRVQPQPSNLPRHLQGLSKAGGKAMPMASMSFSASADPRMSVSASAMSSWHSQGKAPMPFPPQKMFMKAPLPNPSMKVMGATTVSSGNSGIVPSRSSSIDSTMRGRSSTMSPTAMRAALTASSSATPAAAAAAPSGINLSRRSSVSDPRVSPQQRTKSVVSLVTVSDDSGSRNRSSRGGLESGLSIDSVTGSRAAPPPQRTSQQVHPSSILVPPQQQHFQHRHQMHHQHQQMHHQHRQYHHQFHHHHHQQQQQQQSTMGRPTPSLAFSQAESSPQSAKGGGFWSNVKNSALSMLGAKGDSHKNEVNPNPNPTPTRYARGGVSNNRSDNGPRSIKPGAALIPQTGNNTAEHSRRGTPLRTSYESQPPQQQRNSSPNNRSNPQSLQQSQHLGNSQLPQPHHVQHHQMQHQMHQRTTSMQSVEPRENTGKDGTKLQGSAASAPRPAQTAKTVVLPTASHSSGAAGSDGIMVSPKVHLRDEVGEAGIAPSSVVHTSGENEPKSQQPMQARRVFMFPSLSIVDSDEDSSEVSANNGVQQQQQQQQQAQEQQKKQPVNQVEDHPVEQKQKQQEVPHMQSDDDISPAETPERQKLNTSASSLDVSSALTPVHPTHEDEGADGEGGTASTQLHTTSDHRVNSPSRVPPQPSIADEPTGKSTISKSKEVSGVNVEVEEKKKKKVVPEETKLSLKSTKVSSKEISNTQPLNEKKAKRILSLSPGVRKRKSVPQNQEKDNMKSKGSPREEQEHQESQRQRSVDSLTTSSESSIESLETEEKRGKRTLRQDKSQEKRKKSSVSLPRRHSTDSKSPVKNEKKKKNKLVPVPDKKNGKRSGSPGSSDSDSDSDRDSSTGSSKHRSSRRHSTSPNRHSHSLDKKKKNRSRSRSGDDSDRSVRRSSLHSLSRTLFQTRDVYQLYRELKKQQHQLQRDRFLRWRQYGTSSPLDANISHNKSGKKSTHGHHHHHSSPPKPWRYTSLHTPPAPPVTPLRRPLGYISLGNGSYRQYSRGREENESGNLNKSSLKGGNRSPARSSPISARSTWHTIDNGNRTTPLHSHRHMLIPQSEEQNRRVNSTGHSYELFPLMQSHKYIDPYEVHGSPNGNHHSDVVGNNTWMRRESFPERRGVSPIQRFNVVTSPIVKGFTQPYFGEKKEKEDNATSQNSKHPSHSRRRSASVPHRRYSTAEQQQQQQSKAEIDIPSPVFSPAVNNTPLRASPHQTNDKHRTERHLGRRCSGDTVFSGHTYLSSHSPPILTNASTANNIALDTTVSLPSSLSEDVLKISLNRGNMNGSDGASELDEPISIPVVDLRKEFKPQLEISPRGRSKYGVKNTTPSHCRSNHHMQIKSGKSVLNSRHGSTHRSAHATNPSPTRYVDIPQEKLFSSFDVKEPERPSAWAMGPERSNLLLNSPKTRRRLVKKTTSHTVMHTSDDNEVDVSGSGKTTPVLIVEELRLDEQRRPYMLIREVPYGPAAVAAQRDSVERLSKPRPVFVRREDGIP
ncbi:hypothetical protein LSM04_004379 [Trypanosoma melophagium]|uniref:uncharacterized protein n=1 Tax=Trypanosoma melophagium TaxID=715481 RepID=UPI00351A4AB1|nr:hypothetical protein LSM04_004379 [Trypanosoma melophagium]